MTAIRRLTFGALALLIGSCGPAAERSQAEPLVDDGWAFSYPTRPATSSASPLLDLRSLNEPVAGRSGFVRLSGDGSSFVLGDGTPVRFWAVGSEVYKQPPEAIARHVRFLAKVGVNMVRLHADLAPKGVASKIDEVDEKEIDGIRRFVAEAKKEGIYTTISPYWATGKTPQLWGIEGYDQPGDLWGLLFFNETLQEGYKGWVRALYAPANPYTGIPLAKDPAVGLIQIQNEDSIFFWTTGTIRPPQAIKLGRKFAEWLREKYGSLGKAKAAWGDATHKDDDVATGRVGLVDVYQMTQKPAGGLGRRVDDQVAFFAALQRRFYASMAAFYREDLGCKQLINASNWRTADQARLDDLERWTYTATDVIAANRYYNGGVHTGPQSSWRIDPGDHFSQKSALVDPRSLPLNLRQVVGHPMIVSEGSWVPPLAFQAEGPFLAAVYQSLTGVDAFYWFTMPRPEFDDAPFFPFAKVRGQSPIGKFTAGVPPILGGFPASALLFRKGYVKQGAPAIHEERTMKSVRDRDLPLLGEDPAFDPNRDRGVARGASGSASTSAVDPLAFLVGPVEVKFDGDPSRTRVLDLAPFVDRDKKTVRSVTGEVNLDYGKGVCTVDAPKAQGACGFLAQAVPIALKDLGINSTNAYAAVLAVPLDDLPLVTSRKVLIQVTTAARPTGWKTRDAEFPGEDGKTRVRGLEVVETGRLPWRVASTAVAVALKNPGLTRATRLDPAGYAAEKVAVVRKDGGISVGLPPQTMYLLLE